MRALSALKSFRKTVCWTFFNTSLIVWIALIFVSCTERLWAYSKENVGKNNIKWRSTLLNSEDRINIDICSESYSERRANFGYSINIRSGKLIIIFGLIMTYSKESVNDNVATWHTDIRSSLRIYYEIREVDCGYNTIWSCIN